MPPPKAIICHLCNGKYFKHSFPIHLKKCEEKWKKTHSRCEKCGSIVANHDWSDHRMHCKVSIKKSQRRKISKEVHVPKSMDLQTIPTLSNGSKVLQCEECETENATWNCVECEQSLCSMCEVELHKKGSRIRHQRIPLSVSAFKQKNMAHTNTTNDSLQPPEREEQKDFRKECKFCQRKFNPDRVEKHMRICMKISKKKNRRKVYDGAKKRIEGTPFEEFMYNRSETPQQVLEWKKNGRRWKQESAQLREIALIQRELTETEEKSDGSIKGKKDKKNKEKEKDISIEISVTSSSSNNTSFSKSSYPSNASRNTKFNANKSKVNKSIKKISNYGSSKNNQTKNLMINNRKRINNNYNKMNNKNNKQSVNLGISNSLHNKQSNKNNEKDNNIKKRSNVSYPKQSKRAPLYSRRTSNPNKDNKPSITNNRNTSLSKPANRKPSMRYRSSLNNSNQSSEVLSEIPKSNQSSLSSSNRNSFIQKKKEPIPKKVKSAAQSLPRGQELGVNVNKMFNKAPKNMDEYRERERLRREQLKNQKKSNSNKMRNVSNQESNQTNKFNSKISKTQIRQEIKIKNQPIGGTKQGRNRMNNLKQSRADRFEYLMNQS